jgi:hypothetical protein
MVATASSHVECPSSYRCGGRSCDVKRSCKQREAGAPAATDPSAHGSTMAESGGGGMRCGVWARPASPASLARSPQALLHDAGWRKGP